MSAVRVLVGSMALATVLGALAGCTDDGDGPDPSPTTSPTPSASPTVERRTLTFHVYGDATVVAAYRDIAAAYTASNPDLRIRIRDYPDATTAAEATTAELESESGPDLFLLDQAYLPQFVNDGHLQPVDGLLEERGLEFGDDYQRVALTAFSANSGLQCMPAEMSPLVVFYNKRLVPRRQLLAQGFTLPDGVKSWDWEDFEAAARAAAARGRGTAVRGAYLPADLQLLTAFVRSAGSDVVDDVLEPTSLTLTSDAALETVTSIAELTRDPAVSLTPEEIVAKPPVARFLDEQLAMLVGTRSLVPQLRTVEGLRFDVFPLPSFGKSRSVADINGLCINADSELVEEAADFIAFAVGPIGAGIAASSGAMVPASLDSIVSDDFVQPGQQPASSEVFVSSVRRSDLMPYSEAWLDVAEVASGVLTRIYLNPDLDLDEKLEPRLEKLNARSETLFAGEAE